MKKALSASASFALAAVLSATAWAASPLGALNVHGKATITAQDARFTLQDQEYAYFSNDKVNVGADSQAVVTTTEGLKVTFLPFAQAQITRKHGTYEIDVQKGAIMVDVRDGVPYQLLHAGEPVAVGAKYMASDRPYVASVATSGDVRFYMPAQMSEQGSEEDDDDRLAFILWLLGAISLVTILEDGDGGAAGEALPPPIPVVDDEGPSSPSSARRG